MTALIFVARRHLHAGTTRAYALVAFFFFVYAASEFFMYTAPNPDAAASFVAWLLVGAAALPFGLLVFLRALQGKSWLSGKVMAGFAFFAAVAYLATQDQLASGMTMTAEGYAYLPGPWFAFYAIGFLAFFALAVSGIAVYYLENKQTASAADLRLFVIGSAVVLVGTMTGNLFLPLVGLPAVRLATLLAAVYGLLLAHLADVRARD